MDKTYCQQLLDKLNTERSFHNDKFAGSSIHENCLVRFDKVITELQDYLNRSPTHRRLDCSNSESALPDAIENARIFKEAAKALFAGRQYGPATLLMDKAREIVSKEMNELDGFDR